jgi:hypothetical protein
MRHLVIDAVYHNGLVQLVCIDAPRNPQTASLVKRLENNIEPILDAAFGSNLEFASSERCVCSNCMTISRSFDMRDAIRVKADSRRTRRGYLNILSMLLNGKLVWWRQSNGQIYKETLLFAIGQIARRP